MTNDNYPWHSFRETSASNLLKKILTFRDIFQHYLWHYVVHRKTSDFYMLLLCISFSRSLAKMRKNKQDMVDYDLLRVWNIFFFVLYITDGSRAKRYRAVLSACCHGYNYIRRQKRSRDLSLDPFFLYLFQEADVTRD